MDCEEDPGARSQGAPDPGNTRSLYVKLNKSDIIDAEAIAEAATRPTMRFAAIKSEEQADLQALHRVRDQMIGTRTRLINQMRAFCLEYGIALRQSVIQARPSADAGRFVERLVRGDAKASHRSVQ